MSRLAPIVASLSLIAYVAAIGIDCERGVAVARAARGSAANSVAPSHALPMARRSVPPSVHRDAATASSSHARSGHAGGHWTHAGSPPTAAEHRTAHQPGRHHAGRHGLGPRDAETGESAPRDFARKAESSHLKLVPTCLCGCSKTRSRIGGPAGRLGAVVPGLVISSLPEAALERGFAPRSPRRFGIVLGREPIPI